MMKLVILFGVANVMKITNCNIFYKRNCKNVLQKLKRSDRNCGALENVQKILIFISDN